MMCDKKLLETIEEKRNELVKSYEDFGLNSPKVIQQSQELDRLLNFFEQVKSDLSQNNKNTQ